MSHFLWLRSVFAGANKNHVQNRSIRNRSSSQSRLVLEPLENRDLLTVFADSFDGTAIDLVNWKLSSPLNASSVTQDDKLNITNDGTAGGFGDDDFILGPGSGLSLRCRLSGDFDVQVDFSDFSPTGSEFTQAFFNINQDSTHALHIKRIEGGAVDGVQTVFVNGGGIMGSGVSPVMVNAGAFKIERAGDTITTYFDNGNGFSQHFVQNGLFTGDVSVSLVLLGSPGELVSVSYDNFLVNAGFLSCPTGEDVGDVVDDLVANGDLSVAAGDSLHATIRAALASISSGKTKAAKNQLNATIKKIESLQRDGEVSLEVAQDLIGMITNVVNYQLDESDGGSNVVVDTTDELVPDIVTTLN